MYSRYTDREAPYIYHTLCPNRKRMTIATGSFPTSAINGWASPASMKDPQASR